MKKLLVTCLIASAMCSCNQKTSDNPFFTAWNNEYEAPDFSLIKPEHYEPAFKKGIEQQNKEIEQIVENKEKPTFENTVVALDNSGEILDRVSAVFDALVQADTNDSLDEINKRMSPLLSEHNDNIYLNEDLFERIKAVHNDEEQGKIKLTTEQHSLLDRYYKRFKRNGADLSDDQQEKLREINKNLSALAIEFDQHLLNENNAYQLVIDKEEDLAGLPQSVREGAAEEAKAAGKEGKWLFTLQNSSRLPFLQYAENRELRKQIYTAYTNRCNHDDANDNKEVLKKIISLRLEKAKLLGFEHYADYVLDVNMAKNAQTVMDFLQNLWKYSLRSAQEEAKALQTIMDREKKGEKLAAWDWWYYAEKLRKEKYDLDEAELKPYFSLDDVRNGLYYAANKLYGIHLEELNNVPVYEPDVKVYKVTDADGSYLGLFYADYFPRAGKAGGAWMSNFREQVGEVRPLIYNVASFTKPTGNLPSLLTLDEVETMFHEFGHALHGMLSKCNYKGIAGTNVTRDFVETLSQINEHWAFEPEVLKVYAKHYKTREAIPDELIQKIQNQEHFNQGFMTTELLAAAILDMELHMLTDTDDLNVMEFEKQVMDKLNLIPEIAPRYRATYFAHIVGGYAAGYYSYLWAEVLEADAYEAFREKGIFDPATAQSFRKNILEKGGSDDPMNLFKAFRGREPEIGPLLKNRGLSEK